MTMFLLGILVGAALTLVAVILWGLTVKPEDILRDWTDPGRKK
jgi:hypothetical protein